LQQNPKFHPITDHVHLMRSVPALMSGSPADIDLDRQDNFYFTTENAQA
jgi:hypothetical protein